MAAIPTFPAAAGGALLVCVRGFFMPPRILLAPAGTRLPRGVGVHAVAVVAGGVPAAPGSGCAMGWALAAAGRPHGAGLTGGADDDDDKVQEEDAAFYGHLEAKGVEAVKMLGWIEPPAHLLRKSNRIEHAVEKAVKMARAKEDKGECVKALLYGIYGIIDLAKDSVVPNQQTLPRFLNFDKSWFEVMMMAAKVHDTDAMMKSITCALDLAAKLLRSDNEE